MHVALPWEASHASWRGDGSFFVLVLPALGPMSTSRLRHLRVAIGIGSLVVVMMSAMRLQAQRLAWNRHLASEACLLHCSAALADVLWDHGSLPISPEAWTPLAVDCDTPTALGKLLIDRGRASRHALIDAFGNSIMVRGVLRPSAPRVPPVRREELAALTSSPDATWVDSIEVASFGANGTFDDTTGGVHVPDANADLRELVANGGFENLASVARDDAPLLWVGRSRQGWDRSCGCDELRR
jgi:hypothetical protein